MLRLAFVEVPPRKPKNISLVVPLHAETSIIELDESVFVGTNLAGKVNRVFVPIAHAIKSWPGLPATLKSNAIPEVLVGMATLTQAAGGSVAPATGCPDEPGAKPMLGLWNIILSEEPPP